MLEEVAFKPEFASSRIEKGAEGCSGRSSDDEHY